MRGRIVALLLVFLLAAAMAGQTVRWRHRMAASRLLRGVELRSEAAYRSGQAPVRLMADHLEILRQAAPLNPVEVGIPMVRGTQYLFLHRFDQAASAYEEALALEPQSVSYFALGRVQWLAGRRDEARRNFALAVRLDPRLARQVPPEAR